MNLIHTGSGSTTSIRFSHPSSPLTQKIPKVFRSHSSRSPVLTHRGSLSGFSLSKWMAKVTLDGMISRDQGGNRSSEAVSDEGIKD